MIFGWSRKCWIFNSLMNCTNKFYFRIFFFWTTFNATIIPLRYSFARKTVPNLPSPSLLIILKCSFWMPCLLILYLPGDLVWLRMKEGKVFSDLWVCKTSVLEVEEVSFSGFEAFPPEFLALKKVCSFSGTLGLLFVLRCCSLVLLLSMKIFLFWL